MCLARLLYISKVNKSAYTFCFVIENDYVTLSQKMHLNL